MNPRLILAVAVALFLRWLATGHVTVTIARTPVTLPALAVAGTVVTITALATAAVAIAAPIDAIDVDAMLRGELETAKPSQAAAKVAKLTGLDRKGLYARALEESGRTDEALYEYQAVANYYPGAEARVRYGLLLDKAGQVKIADFGIAKMLGSDSTPDEEQGVGTPHYMAP